MSARVAAIVRCANAGRWLYTSVRSLTSQTCGEIEIVLVTDETTPAGTRAWIEALAHERGWQCAHSSPPRPAAVRNTGIALTSAPYVVCLDAGDTLHSSWLAEAAHVFATDSDVGFVTSWTELRGPLSLRRVVAPEACTAGAIARDLDAVHDATVFRRDTWQRLGGFDEQFAALEGADFWLRVLRAGARGELLPRPFLVRQLRRDALYRQRWLERAGDVAALARRHADAFAADVGQAMESRAHVLEQLAEEYRQALSARDTGLRDVEALRARAAALRERLPTELRDAVDVGDLRRTSPVSVEWGYERGQPIDRIYIEAFLSAHADDIRGHVLEVSESAYTTRYGGRRVTQSDVLDIEPANPGATIIADLRAVANVPRDTYDCIILTQTLQVIDDAAAVVAECARILKPGGVVLATLPAVSRVVIDYGDEGDFGRVTAAGAAALFRTAFDARAVESQAYGNALGSAAFLYGLSAGDVSQAELEASEPFFPTLVGVRARKTGEDRTATRHRHRQPRAAILRYYRLAQPSSDVHQLALTPALFRAHLRLLRDRCDVLPLDELVKRTESGLARDAIALTFDDAYEEQASVAAPLLAEWGLPATFFVTTGTLRDSEYWWDTLERLLLTGAMPVPSVVVPLPTGSVALPVRTWAERLETHWRLYHALIAAGVDEQRHVCSSLVDILGETAPPVSARRMRLDEMVAIDRVPGLVVAAHTVNHPVLPNQPGHVQRSELADNKATLEASLGRAVDAFAYPFGALDDAVVTAVGGAGFASAVTCEESVVGSGMHPLRLPRFEVNPSRARRFGFWLEEILEGEPRADPA